MQEQDRKELMRLVSGWLNSHGDITVADIIMDAHLGMPDGVLVNSSNMHLVRQFRNSVSAEPADLISAAISWRGGLT